MTTPGVLSDGTRIRYGMGIRSPTSAAATPSPTAAASRASSPRSRTYPDDDLIVVVLLNTAGPVAPRDLAKQIVDLVLPSRHCRQTFSDDVAPYAGTSPDTAAAATRGSRIAVRRHPRL